MAYLTPSLKVLASDAGGSRQSSDCGRLLLPADRRRENRALCTHARTVMDARAVLAFRCECDQPLCREVVVLTLAEYDARTAGSRAVVAHGHAEADARDVVERARDFCIVEETRVAV
jgi:hypothetical protein